MPLPDAADAQPEWSGTLKCLHWLMALLIVVLCAMGWWMQTLPNSPDKIRMYALHKSLGLTLLALALMRLFWRLLLERAPPLPPFTPAWQTAAARCTHAALYALMLAMPLSGWLYNSAANFPLRWFWLFPVPALWGPDPQVKHWAAWAHEVGFWILALLFVVHVGAALWHHFRERDPVMHRMLPTKKHGPSP